MNKFKHIIMNPMLKQEWIDQIIEPYEALELNLARKDNSWFRYKWETHVFYCENNWLVATISPDEYKEYYRQNQLKLTKLGRLVYD